VIAMSVSIETDLKDILNRIEQKFDTISQDSTTLKVGQAELSGKIDGMSKRLENLEFISRGILIGLVVAFFGAAAKLLGFVPT
jgi:hypothetical protein